MINKSVKNQNFHSKKLYKIITKHLINSQIKKNKKLVIINKES
jgi:hypothetical protein